MSGGDGGDPQKLKRIAAAAYDYDNDQRWPDYWSNVLIPPHMASRNDVIDHFKRKFYQRYIDPDLVVEPIATNNSSQPEKASAPLPQSSSSATGNNNTRQRSSGSSNRTSGTSPTPTPPPNSTSLRWDPQTIQFSVNAWVFVVAILAIFPLVPKSLSSRAYRLSFLGTASSSIYSMYSLYGTPRAWNMQGLQVWFQSVITTKDFIHAIYCLNFVTPNQCLKFALIPILCRALEHVAKFLRRNFSRSTLYRKYLEDACVWVESNTTTLSILSSQAQIGLGFLLIISLFSWQRNFIQAFMYWQLLKLMYHAPVTASYHQSAWAKIGQTMNPLIQRYTPFLVGLFSDKTSCSRHILFRKNNMDATHSGLNLRITFAYSKADPTSVSPLPPQSPVGQTTASGEAKAALGLIQAKAKARVQIKAKAKAKASRVQIQAKAKVARVSIPG
ncbi:hypothetical protein PHJA_002801500 [Phtheirospermum japonicum]|uniref:Transmembrane protein 33 n=1 Tax=Phtheirospermum japonicum TaxID=374723 RepID=A0A830DDK2_9LAMI|nr:hypothetical protein PHJA_002801500 [Phtheirospermum japonicum]